MYVQTGGFASFDRDLQRNGLYGPGTVMDRTEQLQRAENL